MWRSRTIYSLRRLSLHRSLVLGLIAPPKRRWYVHMTQLWHQHLEDGGSSLCVFLDLAKAFDTVPHQGVISAVAKACVSGPALKWIADYLSGCRQFVVLEGASSSLASVTSGVPQGSILGPLLFLTTFDGIFRLPLSASSEITGYADDTTYSMKLRDDSDVKSAVADLDTINHWIASSGFKLSVPKVKMMVISRKRHPPTPTIVIKGHEVEQVSSFKLLGVTISADLSWRQHIHGIVSKAKCLLGFLYRVFGSSNRRCLLPSTDLLSFHIWTTVAVYGTPLTRLTYKLSSVCRHLPPDL